LPRGHQEAERTNAIQIHSYARCYRADEAAAVCSCWPPGDYRRLALRQGKRSKTKGISAPRLAVQGSASAPVAAPQADDSQRQQLRLTLRLGRLQIREITCIPLAGLLLGESGDRVFGQRFKIAFDPPNQFQKSKQLSHPFVGPSLDSHGGSWFRCKPHVLLAGL
jgi:hypothetical protein